MAEVENKAEVVETEATQPELAEENVEASTEENINSEEEKDEENAACKEKKEKAEEETAAVVTHEYHEERHTNVAYDTETGKEVSQTVTIETISNNIQEGTLVESVDGIHVAETVIADDDPPADPPASNSEEESSDEEEESSDEEEDPIPEETDQDSYDPKKKKTAEQMIAELLETVESLKAEVEKLKEKNEVKLTAEINPFMSDINAKGKYSLLETDTAKKQYTLV